jgi:hypothetical protein
MDAAAHKYEFLYGAQFQWRTVEHPQPDQPSFSVVCSLHNLA